MRRLSAMALGVTLILFGLARAADQPTSDEKKVSFLIGRLNGNDDKLRLEAVKALGEMGPLAAKAAPALVFMLKLPNEDVRLNAAIALGRIGKDAVGPVATGFKNPDSNVRYYAVWALALIGPDAKDKASDVVKLLNDLDPEVQRKAVYALGQIGAAPDIALPPLVKLLGDKNHEISATASESIARFGSEAVPSLVKALDSREVRVRLAALKALGAVELDDADVINRIAACLADADYTVLTEARTALVKLGDASLPAIKKVMWSDRSRAGKAATEALGLIGSSAATDLLVEALKAPHWEMRAEAARALGIRRGAEKLVVLALADTMNRDEHINVRVAAAFALQALGSAAKLAEPALRQALGDDERYVRESAFQMLGNFHSKPALIAEQQMERAESGRRVNMAAVLLNLVDPNHAAALRVMDEALAAKDAQLRFHAAFTLSQQKASHGETVNVLIEALQDNKQSVRVLAATRLAHLAGKADPAQPALIEALKDKDATVRQMICWALSQTTATPDDALKAMGKVAAGDRDGQVRMVAVNSIHRRFGDEGFQYYLDAMLNDKDINVRQAASGCLRECKKVERKAIPVLIDLAKKEPDLSVRLGAMATLGNLGDESIPILVDLLASDHRGDQYHLMAALQQHGAKAKAAVPRLIEILKKGDDDMRPMAALTLGKIGPDAKDAIAALKAVVNDPTKGLGQCAYQALKQIEKE